jgi:hypothetical protein
MYERDRNRTFTDSRCNALDVISAYVANRKNSGKTGFQKERQSSLRPLRVGQIFLR